MIVPALLVFFSTFGVMGGVLAVVSLGTAPLWLLAGGPLLMASWLSIAMLRSGRPEPVRSPWRESIVRRAEAAAERMELVLGLFFPFVTTGLLVVLALPLHGAVEAAAGLVAAAGSMVCAILVTKDERRPHRAGA